MKKLIYILIIAFSFNAYAELDVENIFNTKNLKIAGPCIVGYTVASLLSKDNATAIGLSVCAMSATQIYLFPDSYDDTLKSGIESKMNNRHQAFSKKVNTQLEKQRESYAIYRDVIRKVVAVEIRRLDKSVKRNIRSMLKKPKFKALVNRQIKEIINKQIAETNKFKINRSFYEGVHGLLDNMGKKNMVSSYD